MADGAFVGNMLGNVVVILLGMDEGKLLGLAVGSWELWWYETRIESNRRKRI